MIIALVGDPTVIDLHRPSADYHNRIGSFASMAFNPQEGDMTHYNARGAEVVAELIVDELRIVACDLAAHLR